MPTSGGLSPRRANKALHAMSAEHRKGWVGLYHGVPLTKRGTGYSGFLPDHITIYRTPILRICGSEEAVVRQVGITVIHEVAHHFGISDERLHELGYG